MVCSPTSQVHGSAFMHYQLWKIKSYEMTRCSLTQCPFQISCELVNLFKSWNEGDKHTNSAQWSSKTISLWHLCYPQQIYFSINKKRMGPIQFQSHLVFSHLPQWCISILKESRKGMLKRLLFSDHPEYGNISEKYLPIQIFLRFPSHILINPTSFISTPILPSKMNL
jgi:hypothetical protein